MIMRKNTFYLVLSVLFSVLFMFGCGEPEEKTANSGKAKIVEVTEEAQSNTTEESLNQAEEIAENIEETEQATAEISVFEGSFVDASVLDMSYFYFFKDKSGTEKSFYFNPQENSMNQTIPFFGPELAINKDLVGKMFKIKYVSEQREDDNTGEMTTYNIPSSIVENSK